MYSQDPPCGEDAAEVDASDAHIHDIDLLYSGDSPHPVALECKDPECDWNGLVTDGV